MSRPERSREKAAIIVRLMRALDADLGLSHLPESSQISLARALGAMGPIDRDTLNATVSEFTDAIDAIAMAGTGGVSKALETLDGQISPKVAAQMTEEAAQGDPAHAWVRLARLSDAQLAEVITEESTEISALLLSKLPVAKSATILGLIPGDKARRIACTTAHIDTMPADAVARVAYALVEDHCIATTPVFDKDAVSRVGEMLNSTQRDRREEVLTGLDEDDPHFAEQVRKAIFTIANIPDRIEPLDIPKVVRKIDAEQLTIALAGALRAGGEEERAADFVLDNMSKRMSEQIRDDVKAIGQLRRSVIDEAQTALVNEIKDAIDTGEITVVVEEDEE